MCALIAATREMEWTAMKISPHAHEASPFGDTERYLAAGAKRAMLLVVADHLPDADNLIIESNAILDRLKPDLLFFVTGGNSEIKPSAEGLLERAQSVIGPEGVTLADIALLRAIARQPR